VLLVHVLFNLLKNALYHVAEAGKGEIFVWTEPNAVGENRLYFMDTGTGIHPSVLPRIFDRFYSSMSRGRGSGIGLSFCRMVMDGFGGSIECESVHGEFTRFILSFPKDERP
jgi:two-component system CAI-1 autoinducer sensor kinase/phosphatase CqsS